LGGKRRRGRGCRPPEDLKREENLMMPVNHKEIPRVELRVYSGGKKEKDNVPLPGEEGLKKGDRSCRRIREWNNRKRGS